MPRFTASTKLTINNFMQNTVRSELLALFLIVIGVCARLLPHAPNMSPIGAIALFSGAMLTKKSSMVLPLVIMFVSDFFLGFHSLMAFTYGSYLLIGIFAHIVLKKNVSVFSVLGSSLLASIVFYVVTNFGVWLEGRLYPPTISGLISSYAMAIPFFQNTLLGDLISTSVIFGSYYVVITSMNVVKQKLASSRIA